MRLVSSLLLFFLLASQAYSQAGGFTNSGQDVFRWDGNSASGTSFTTLSEPFSGGQTLDSKGNTVGVFNSTGSSFILNSSTKSSYVSTPSFTFEGIFRPTKTNPTDDNYILEYNAGGSGTEGTLKLSVNRGRIILGLNSGNITPSGDMVYNINPNNAYIHVAFTSTYDGSQYTIRLYYNGIQLGSTTLSSAPSFDFDLAEGGGGDSYVGDMDDMRIWTGGTSWTDGARNESQLRAYGFSELINFPSVVPNLYYACLFGSDISDFAGGVSDGENYAYNRSVASDGRYYMESANKATAGINVDHTGNASLLANAYANRVMYVLFETPAESDMLLSQVLYQEGTIDAGYVLSMNNGNLTFSYHNSTSSTAWVTYRNGANYPIGLNPNTRYVVEARVLNNNTTSTKIALYVNGIFAGESWSFSSSLDLSVAGQVSLGSAMNETVLPVPVGPGQTQYDNIYAFGRSSMFRGKIYEYAIRNSENVSQQIITTNYFGTTYGIALPTSGSANISDYFNERTSYVYQAAGMGYTSTSDVQLTSNSDIRVIPQTNLTGYNNYTLWAHNGLSDGLYDIGYNSNTQNAPLNVKLQKREWLVQGQSGSIYENYVAEIRVPVSKYPSLTYGQELVAVIDTDRDGNYRTGSYVVVLKRNDAGTEYVAKDVPFQNVNEPVVAHFTMRIGFLNQYEYNAAFPSRLVAIGKGNNYDRPLHSTGNLLTLDNETSLKVGDYVLVQDNNAAPDLSGSLTLNNNAGTPTTVKVSDRIWKFNIYGTPGGINISFDNLPALPTGTDHYAVILDADGVFDAATSNVIVLSDYWKKAFAIAVSDGYYMKLGAVQQNHLQNTISPNQTILNPMASGSSLNLTVADQYSFPASSGCVQTMSKSILQVNYSTGDMHQSGDLTFTSSVDITVTGYSDYAMAGTALFTYSTSLALDESNPERVWSLDVASYYPMLKKVKVVVNTYVASGPTVVSNNLRLKMSLEETPLIQIPVTSTSVITNTNIARASTDAASAFIFSWGTLNGCACTSYQMQLLRLYNEKGSYATTPGQEDRSGLVETIYDSNIDWSKALQVEVNKPSVQMLLTEGSGFYIWRVRPIGNYYAGGVADSRNWGSWSAGRSDGEIWLAIDDFDDNGSGVLTNGNILWYDQFERDKNFSYERSFTEGGTIHESITYASALLQGKQSIARLNGNGTESSGTDQELIVTQSVYDFAGRAAISSLPTPITNDNDIGYQEQFLKNSGNLYTAFNFDTDDNAIKSGIKIPDPINDGVMNTYYSDANPDPSIPSADGYGFTRTVFDNNGTNDVVEQSGVGPVHAITATAANSHTVKISQSSASEQELLLVFGDEAPAATSVFKTITTDQNNITSITYTDKEGKVIATCLAGREALCNPGDAQTPYYTDPIPVEGTPEDIALFKITVDKAINNNIPYGDHGLQASETFTFTDPVHLIVSYDITPSLIKNMCGNYCATCGYVVRIDINDLDDPGSLKEVHKNLPISMKFRTDNGCTSEKLTPFDIPPIDLCAGHYSISRTIVPDMSEANKFADNIVQAENDKITSITDPLVKVLRATGQSLTAGQQAYGNFINGSYASADYDVVLYDKSGNQILTSVGASSGGIDNTTLQTGYSIVMMTSCCTLNIPVVLPLYNPCNDNQTIFNNAAGKVIDGSGFADAMIKVLAEEEGITVGPGFDYANFKLIPNQSDALTDQDWNGTDFRAMIVNMTTSDATHLIMDHEQCENMWKCWNGSASVLGGGVTVPDVPENTDAAIQAEYDANKPNDGTTLSTMGTNLDIPKLNIVETVLDCYGRNYIGFANDPTTYRQNAFRVFYRDPATQITGGTYCDKVFCSNNQLGADPDPNNVAQEYCVDTGSCVITYPSLSAPDNANIKQDYVINPGAVPAILGKTINQHLDNLALKSCLVGVASMPAFNPATDLSITKLLADATIQVNSLVQMCQDACENRDDEFRSAMLNFYDPGNTGNYTYYNTGDEKVVNGNFDTNLLGWTCSGNWAQSQGCNGSSSVYAYLSTDGSNNGHYTSAMTAGSNYGITTGLIVQTGKKYRLSFELTNKTLLPAGMKLVVRNNDQVLYTITDADTYTESIVFNGTTLSATSAIGFYVERDASTPVNPFVVQFDLDNVSLRELVSGTGMPVEDVCCMAQSLTDYCKKQCKLDVITEDCDHDGNPDKLVRIGTEAQGVKWTAIMYGDFQLSETSTIGGVADQCGAGWDRVTPDENLTTPAACLNGVPTIAWDVAYENNNILQINKDADNNMYVYYNGGKLQKIDPATGALMWSAFTGTGTYSASTKIICLGNEEFIFTYPDVANNGDIVISRKKYDGTPSLTDVYANGFTRNYGGSGYDVLVDIIQKDNHFIIGASSNSVPNTTDQSLDPLHGSRKTSANYGGTDYWIFKINGKGDVLPESQMSFGGDLDDQPGFFKMDNTGNFYFIGISNSTINTGTKKINSPLGFGYWIVKIKNDLSSYDQLFQSNTDFIQDLLIENEDKYIYIYYSNPEYPKFYLKEYQKDVLTQNKLVYDGGTLTVSYQLSKAADGGYYLLGFTQQTSATSTNHDPFFGSYDYFLVKVDENYTYEWDRSFGGDQMDFIFTGIGYNNIIEINGKVIFGAFSQSAPYSGGGNRTAPYLGTPGDNNGWLVGLNLGSNTSCTPKNMCIKWIPPGPIDTGLPPNVPPQQPEPPLPDDYVLPTPTAQVADNIPFQVAQCGAAKYNDLVQQYLAACMNGTINDLLHVEYKQGYSHYTLYYYDRAGNLARTVPPMGVKPLDVSDPNVINRQVATQHRLKTVYEYNSLGQLVYQKTPDGGVSNFIYNSIGQLRFSQNARQAGDNTCSYTKYDELGRILEVGECSLSTAGVAFSALTPYADANGLFTSFGSKSFPTLGNAQQTITVYTDAATQAAYLDQGQSYLRNRVSYVYTFAINGERAVSYYSYDPHGNVNWMMQELPGQSRNTIGYDYDLISNKVLCAKYNEGQPDAFYHKYDYDADDRITAIYTSRDRMLWDKDAAYKYYKHGVLKRTEFGEDAIQGVDHTYTIQGWLKALNSPSLTVAADAGNDGGTGSNFATDEYGMALNYYKGDFTRTASNIYNPVPTTSGTPGAMAFMADDNRQLFNGNISSWVSRVEQEHRDYLLQGGGNTDNTVNSDKFTTANYYTYDDLNRITSSAFSEFNSTGSASANGDKFSRLTATGKFGTSYTYDGNGNINSLKRYSVGSGGAAQLMDNLSYSYKGATGAGATGEYNQLTAIQDAIGAGDFDDDVDTYSGTRYTYDAIGNLIQDAAEGINISWTVYGKVSTVTRISPTSSIKPEVRYTYDAMGQRIKKEVNMTPYNSSGVAQRLPDQVITTFYVHDASGNTMSIYKRQNTAVSGQTGYYTAEYDQTEIPIYGSSRVGMYEPDAVEGIVASKKFQTSDLDNMLYDRTASNHSNYDGYWNVATRENSTINNTSAVPVSIAGTGLWNTTNSGDATASVYTFNKSKAHTFSGKVGNAVAHGLNANGQVQFTAFTAFDYFGTSNKLVVLSGANNLLMKGAESLTADPKAQIVITQVPGSNSKYLLITNLIGSIGYYMIDMNQPGYGTTAAPQGEVYAASSTAASIISQSTPTANYGRSFLIRENKLAGTSLLYATRYVPPVLPADAYGHVELLAYTLPSADAFSSNPGIMSTLVPEVMCRPAGLLTTEYLYNSTTQVGYSGEEQGELAFNAKGDELLYYAQGMRLGWFSHQTSQVLAYTIGYDGKIAKNALVAKYTVPVTDPTLPGASVAVSNDGRFVYYTKDQLYATNGSAAHIWRYDLRNGTNAEVSGVNIAGDLRTFYSGLLVEVADNKSETALSLQETDLGATQAGLHNVAFSAVAGQIGNWPLQNFRIYAAATGTSISVRKISRKRYELSDHLGNVTVVVTDRKAATYISLVLATKAKVASYTNYYAFGMGIKTRSNDGGEDYRYGYNGKEHAKEVDDYDYDFGARIYDAKICRWFAVDPHSDKYVDVSVYIFVNNNPIKNIEIDGREWGDVNVVILINDHLTVNGKVLNPWMQVVGANQVFHVNNLEELHNMPEFQKIKDGSVDNLVFFSHGPGGGPGGSSGIALRGKDEQYAFLPDEPKDLKAEGYAKQSDVDLFKKLFAKLDNNPVVLFAACGGGTEEQFSLNIYNLVESNSFAENITVILNKDDSQGGIGHDTNWSAGFMDQNLTHPDFPNPQGQRLITKSPEGLVQMEDIYHTSVSSSINPGKPQISFKYKNKPKAKSAKAASKPRFIGETKLK